MLINLEVNAKLHNIIVKCIWMLLPDKKEIMINNNIELELNQLISAHAKSLILIEKKSEILTEFIIDFPHSSSSDLKNKNYFLFSLL
jgi:hypothetical protein